MSAEIVDFTERLAERERLKQKQQKEAIAQFSEYDGWPQTIQLLPKQGFDAAVVEFQAAMDELNQAIAQAKAPDNDGA